MRTMCRVPKIWKHAFGSLFLFLAKFPFAKYFRTGIFVKEGLPTAAVNRPQTHGKSHVAAHFIAPTWWALKRYPLQVSNSTWMYLWISGMNIIKAMNWFCFIGSFNVACSCSFMLAVWFDRFHQDWHGNTGFSRYSRVSTAKQACSVSFKLWKMAARLRWWVGPFGKCLMKTDFYFVTARIKWFCHSYPVIFRLKIRAVGTTIQLLGGGCVILLGLKSVDLFKNTLLHTYLDG